MKSKETEIKNKMNKKLNKKENNVININKDNVQIKRLDIIALIIAITYIKYNFRYIWTWIWLYK